MDNKSQIAEIDKILEELEIAAQKSERRLLKIREAQNIISEAQARLEKILTPDSIAYRIYDRAKIEKNPAWEVDISQYVLPNDRKNFDTWIGVIREILNEIEPEFLRGEYLDKKQFFFSEGEVYRAKKEFFKIMKKALQKIYIVDPYLDEEIFDYIDSLDDSLCFRLITANKKSMFRKLLKALQNTRSKIEAKEAHNCHDRFLIIDNAEIWHLGTSINSFGRKAFMINRVVDSSERDRFIMDINNWWQSGIDI